MTINEAADKVNNWAVLTALARVSMFLTPLLLTLFLFVAGNWLNAYNVRMDRAEARLAATEQDVGALKTRSAVIGPTRDQFQRDTQQTFREIAAALSILQQNDSRILQRLDDLKGANP